MRILHRYVLTAFLVPLAYCLTTFISLYILADLIDSFATIAAAKPSLSVLVAYFSGVVSPYLEWLFAAALLLASLYAMWQLCRHSEVTAMRASGLGLSAIITPMISVAVCLSLLSGVNLEWFVPYAAENVKRLERNQFRLEPADIRTDIHYYNTFERRNWRINRMDVFSPRILDGVRITFERPNGTRELAIACKRAEYRDGMWWLFYPQHTWFDEFDMQTASPTPQLDTLSIRPMPSLNERPEDLVNETREWAHLSVRARLRYIQIHPDLSHDERSSKWYDIHYRFAAPWAGTIITLFAIPLGVATGRQGVLKGILAAITLFFCFFASVNGCMVLAKKELIHPFLGAWLSNVSFFIAGIYLLWRQR